MTSKPIADEEYTDLIAFIDTIPEKKLVMFEKLFERVSNLFDDVTQREKEMLLYAYMVGSTDMKFGRLDHEGGIGD